MKEGGEREGVGRKGREVRKGTEIKKGEVKEGAASWQGLEKGGKGRE